MEILILVTILLNVMHIRSSTLDYFIMNEAHIGEFRAYEDENSGFAPFYMTCNKDKHLNIELCKPGIPAFFEKDGINVITSLQTTFYGCPRTENTAEAFNNDEEHRLLMKKVESVYTIDQKRPFDYVNIYKFNCKKKPSLITWRQPFAYEEINVEHFIGFEVEGYGKIPLAKVFYNHHHYIPIRTKHFVYGRSLASPVAAFNTVEDLQYGDDAATLSHPFTSYHKFNNDKDPLRGTINAYLSENGLSILKGEIVMAHLIPEYDVAQGSWKGIANFAHTIAPMWKDLYTGVWADVENAIREAAFMSQVSFNVYSGTHGRLTFNTDEQKTFSLHQDTIPVTELIWKLVIDERHSKVMNKKAIVIILYNMTEQMAGANTFTEFQPPCVSKCVDFGWFQQNPRNIFCCAVSDVEDKIPELPSNKVHDETYTVLNKHAG